MRRSLAAAGSAVFFVLAPCAVAGLVPWWITAWRVAGTGPAWAVLRPIGAALTIVGGVVVVDAFARFVVHGRGTPAPIAPAERLVVTGLYRYVRNPIYVGVLSAIAGQALLFGQLRLLWYGAGVFAAFALFVRFYEEPALTRQFGHDYEAYRRVVPRWWPRRRPFEPDARARE